MTQADNPIFAKLGLKKSTEVAQGGVTLVLYGAPGVGKTTVALTAIDYFKRSNPDTRALILDAEGGLRSIKSRGDFDFKEITDWRQFERITDELISTPDLRQYYPLLVVDNFSEFAEYGLSSILKRDEEDEATYGNGVWRRYKQAVMVRVRKIRDAARLQRIAVIINLHNREKTDKEGVVTGISAGLIPSIVTPFEGAVDFFGGMESVDSDGHREIHFGTNSRLTSKTRLDLMDPIEAAIPLDLYGPPRPAILSIAPLLATLMGGEPFPVADYAPPQGASPSKFADRQAKQAASAPRPTNGASERPRAERTR